MRLNSQVFSKLDNTEAELKNSAAYKKACISKSTILHFSVKYKFGKSRSNCSMAVFVMRFYFLVLKTDRFWSIRAFSKPIENFSGNIGHYVLDNIGHFFL